MRVFERIRNYDKLIQADPKKENIIKKSCMTPDGTQASFTICLCDAIASLWVRNS